MSAGYVTELARELDRVGIRGSARGRILAEIEDHLSCDPGAELGAPDQIARQFADEVGSRRAIRAAVVSFTGLAIAGIVFALAFLSAGLGRFNPPHLHSHSMLLVVVIVPLVVLAPQVAFASGMLAGLRAFWHRRDPVLTRTDAVVIARRATVATVAGLVTMAALAVLMVEFRAQLQGWWTTLVLIGAGVGAAALLAGTPALMAASAVRPVAAGDPGDVIEDLGPLAPRSLRGRPWRFALLFSAAVALAIALAGAAAGDPFDGAARGLLDGAACLAGFAALGPYLGLR